VLNGCNQENEDDTLINLEESLSKMNNGLAKEFKFKASNGSTTITYLNNDILVSHKGNNKRDISFVLQTSKELGHQKIELTKSKLLYNKRSISIVSKEASKSFVFNIDKKLNNAIEVEIPLYKGFKINEFVTERGYGFATYDAYLDSPENFNEFNNSNEYFGSLHNIETARIMENCDTGGIGAIACSIIDFFATY
jgi:hypothetical protein